MAGILTAGLLLGLAAPPGWAIEFLQAEYSVREGESLRIGVVTTGEIFGTADLQVTAVTAEAGDYSLPFGTSLAFAEFLKPTQYLTISTHQDRDNLPEQLLVTFASVPSGAVIGRISETVVTIVDDDPPSDAPTLVVATQPDGGLRMEWSDIQDPSVTGYQFRYAIPTLEVFRGWADIPASGPGEDNEFSFEPTVYLLLDSQHTFEVRAVNAVGGGPASNVAYAIPQERLVVSWLETDAVVFEGDPVDAHTGRVGLEMSYAPRRDIGIPIEIDLLDTESGDVTIRGVLGASRSGTSGTTISGRVWIPSGTRRVPLAVSANYDVDGDDEQVRFSFADNMPLGVVPGAITSTLLLVRDTRETPPPPPPTLSAEAGDQQATLTWIHPPDVDAAFTSHDYRRTDPELAEFNWTPIPKSATGQQNVSSYTVTGLTNGVEYSFWVRGNNAAGTGLSSNEAKATPQRNYRVSYTQDGYQAAEGAGASTVVISLTPPAIESVSIPITVTPGTAQAGDYTVAGLADGGLTFGPGETARAFTITATDDEVAEGTETVLLGFGTLPERVSVGTLDRATLAISDEPQQSYTVSYNRATYRAAEGAGATTIGVVITPEAASAVTIPITVAPFTAHADDYTVAGLANGTVASGTLTFDPGEVEQSFTLTAVDDGVAEGTETLLLGFGKLAAGVSGGGITAAAVHLDDEAEQEPPPAAGRTVSYSRASYQAVEGAGPITIAVVLTPAAEGETVIPIVVAAGTAQAGDYTVAGLADGALSFAPGEAVQSFTLTATEDEQAEGTETVLLGFGALPAGVSGGAIAAATVALDDEPEQGPPPAEHTVSYGQARYAAVEGAGPTTIAVVLTPTPTAAVAIPITVVSGTAQAGDYTVAGLESGALTFGAGEAVRSFTLTATEDEQAEGTETVLLGFGALPAGVSGGAIPAATVALDDAAGQQPPPAAGRTVSYAQASYLALEGAGPTTVTVVLVPAAAAALSIPITVTAGTAQARDYTVSGLVGGELSFAPGAAAASFTVTGSDDGVVEGEETVLLGFGTLPAGVSAGAIPAATVYLDDEATGGEDPRGDPVPPETARSVSYDRHTYRAAEGSVATRVTVTLVPAAAAEVTVPITVTPGTAQAGDYTVAGLVGGALTFGVGEVTRSFTVTATEDEEAEGTETVLLGFGTLPAGVSRGAIAAATVALDDEAGPEPPPAAGHTVSYGQARFAATEGGAPATIAVVLAPAPTAAVSIPIVVAAGTAQADDYTVAGLVSGSLTFAPGEAVQSFTLTATADEEAEGTETVLLGFGALPAGVSAGAIAAATVALDDQPGPGPPAAGRTVSYAQASYLALEGAGPTTVTVVLVPAAAAALSIPITVAARTAQAGDYTVSGLVGGELSFAPGAAAGTFTVTGSDDGVVEGEETVLLGFGALPAGVSAGAITAATVYLDDEATGGEDPRGDPVPPETARSVSYDRHTYRAAEGSGATRVTVTLVPAAAAEVTVPITVTPGTAQAGDYTVAGLAGGALTFGVGEVTRSFTVTATDDAVAEGTETVLLGFGTLPAGVSAGAIAAATVALDDQPGQGPPPAGHTVSYGQANYLAVEGAGPTTVTVVLTPAPTAAVSIPVAVAAGSAQAGDYTVAGLIDGNLQFAPGATVGTFLVTATHDEEGEGTETVLLGFGTLPAGVSGGAIPAATVVLDDASEEPLAATRLTVSYGKASYRAVEGAGATAISVVIAPPPASSIAIPITVAAGTAQAGDYTVAGLANAAVATGTLTFAAGEEVQSFTLTATDDAESEGTETVLLGFGALPAGASGGAITTPTVYLDDEPRQAPTRTVSYSATDYLTTEGGAAAAITVVLAPAAGTAAIAIPLTVTPGSAQARDYTTAGLTDGALTFAPGASVRTFTMTATEDQESEGEETVLLGFGTLPDGVAGGAITAATVRISDQAAAAHTVSYTNERYAAVEGAGATTITVVLAPAATSQLSIPITIIAGSAQESDYAVAGVADGSLQFRAGDAARSFTITATDDDLAEGEETVLLGFGTLPAGVGGGSVTAATVSLTDTATPEQSYTVSYGQAGYRAQEGADPTPITVVLVPAALAPVSIPITVTAGSAAQDDYQVTRVDDDNLLYVPAGVSAVTFGIAATEDDETEDEETVLLGFGTLPDGVSTGAIDAATVYLYEEGASTPPELPDPPAASRSVSYSQATYRAEEGAGAATIKVVMVPAATSAASIPITVTAGTAAAGDYTVADLVDGTLEFAAGELARSFTIAAADDDETEGEETVQLGFGPLPEGVSGGTITAATVLLDERAPHTVSYDQASYRATEGAGATTVTVLLTPVPERSVSIPITVTAGTAQAEDYTVAGLVDDALLFVAGQHARSFTISAVDDAVSEGAETALLGFGTLPQGVSAGTIGAATVHLEDRATVSYSQASYHAVEGSGTVVTVVMTPVPAARVAIPVTVAPLTAAQGDYTVSELHGGTLLFAAGEHAQRFHVIAVADAESEGEETVALGFGALPDGVSGGAITAATVGLSDHAAAARTVTYGQAAYRAAEGAGATTVTVRISPLPTAAVAIPITVTPDTAAADDYTVAGLVDGALPFAAGEHARTFTITANGDEEVEADETVVLGFGTLPEAMSGGAITAATVTIDDVPRLTHTVSYTQAAYRAAEGAAASTVTVVLTPAADRPRSVPITVTPDTAADDDYRVAGLVDGALAFADGDHAAIFTVRATDDGITEGAETMQLGFGPLPERVSTGNIPAATVTITDEPDAQQHLVSYSQEIYLAVEGEAAATVTVVLVPAATAEVAIPITVTAGSAAAADYTVAGLVTDTLTFAAGDQAHSFTVTAIDDAQTEGTETVLLGFGALPAQVSEGTISSATVNLTDEPLPERTVSYSRTTYQAPEGAGATRITVVMIPAPERALTIPIAVAPATAQPDDYQVAGLIEGALAYAPGRADSSFTISAPHDEETEGEETVQLGFGTLPDGVRGGAITAAQVNLTDQAPEQEQTHTVSYGQETYRAVEGGEAALVTVLLDPPAIAEVAIPITVAPGTAQADDWTVGGLASGALRFAAGEAARSFTLAATLDAHFEGEETVLLGFGSLPEGVRLGEPPAATLLIEDADAAWFSCLNREVVPHVLALQALALTAHESSAMAARLAARAGADGAGYPHRAGQPALFDTLRAQRAAIEAGRESLAELLERTSFSLPVAVVGEPDPAFPHGLALWAGIDRILRRLDSSCGAWDGAVTSAHLGADLPLTAQWLAALSLSRSRGVFNRVPDSAGLPRSVVESLIYSVHPSLGWAPPVGLGVWVTAGLGTGQLDISRGGSRLAASDLSLRSAALGASGLLARAPGATTAADQRLLRLTGEALLARVQVAGDEAVIERQSVTAHRLRLALEGSLLYSSAGGSSAAQALELGVRHDGGAGASGTGVELGASVDAWYPVESLAVAARMRVVLFADQRPEWGVGGAFSLGPGPFAVGVGGWSLRLTPTWGNPASGVWQLWQHDIAALTEGHRSASEQASQRRLEAQIGYGLALVPGLGMVTPYGGLTLSDAEPDRYHLGVRLGIGSQSHLQLTGQRRPGTAAVTLQGQFAF